MPGSKARPAPSAPGPVLPQRRGGHEGLLPMWVLFSLVLSSLSGPERVKPCGCHNTSARPRGPLEQPLMSGVCVRQGTGTLGSRLLHLFCDTPDQVLLPVS